MLQHHHELPAHLSQTVPACATSDPRVEDYLDQLWTPATSARDAADNLQSREEIRVHIESLIEANIELGSSREHAVAQSIEQFGSARTIHRDLLRSRANPNSLRSSLLTALGVNAGASVTSCVSVSMCLRYASQHGLRGAGIVVVIALYVLPVTAGLVTALLAKYKPLLAVLCASLLAMLPALVFDSIVSQAIGRSVVHIGSTGEWLMVLLVALPFSCAGAGFVSLIRWLKHGPRRIVIAW